MPGYEWANHEWLTDAFLAFMSGRGLWDVVVVFFTLLVFLPVMLWIIRAQSWFTLWVVFFISTRLWGFIGVRPQIISFFFFFLLYELLSAVFIKKTFRHGWYAIACPALFFVWANLHAGFLGGLLLVLTFTCVEAFNNKYRALRGARGILGDIGIFILSILVTFINPYGSGLYREIFTIMTSSETARYIFEWRPTILVYPFFFGLLISAVFAFRFRFAKQYSLYTLSAVGIFLLTFIKSVRMVPIFFVLFIPFLNEGWMFLRSEMQRFPVDARERLQRFSRRACVAVPLVLSLYGMYSLFGGSVWFLKQEPVFSCCPDAAVEFLKKEAANGKDIILLNDYGWGGYLIYNAPQFKVFIDGRMPHWVEADGNSAMRDYIALFFPGSEDERARTSEILEKRGVTAVLIRTKHAPQPSPTERIMLALLPKKALTAMRESNTVQSAAHFLVGDTKAVPDLTTFLLENGWDIAYSDDMATVLLKD